MVAVLRCVLVSSNRQMCKYPLVGFVWLCVANTYRILGMEYTSAEGGWWDRIPSSSLCKHLCVCAMWHQIGLGDSMSYSLSW